MALLHLRDTLNRRVSVKKAIAHSNLSFQGKKSGGERARGDEPNKGIEIILILCIPVHCHSLQKIQYASACRRLVPLEAVGHARLDQPVPLLLYAAVFPVPCGLVLLLPGLALPVEAVVLSLPAINKDTHRVIHRFTQSKYGLPTKK